MNLFVVVIPCDTEDFTDDDPNPLNIVQAYFFVRAGDDHVVRGSACSDLLRSQSLIYDLAI